ncbi:MAG: ABC transporter permease subunit [Cyanobacteria bacterium P01_A01_bin.40]
MQQSDKVPWWRDRRTFEIVGQGLVLGIVIATITWMGQNLITNLQRLNLGFGFDFLSRSASFGIANPPIKFLPTDSYLRALVVGLLNSLRVTFFGIIIATILGVTIGISKLSDNWLVSKLASAYVEVLRNTPLLLQLFFWYFAVFLRLPKTEAPLVIGDRLCGSPCFFLTNRGLNVPWFELDIGTLWVLGAILGCLVLAIVVWNYRQRIVSVNSQLWWVLIGFSAIASILLFWWGIDWIIPEQINNLIKGGLYLSPEFATLLIGLSIYTSAFIAEVVRAGIQSVDRGQWEAARALGLNSTAVMQLVILPQALRVMIPPLTSEYLNLIKNSSLAIAIGYSDLYAISNTIFNQTGKPIEIVLIVMLIYLTINLIISLIMNRLNRLVQLTER